MIPVSGTMAAILSTEKDSSLNSSLLSLLPSSSNSSITTIVKDLQRSESSESPKSSSKSINSERRAGGIKSSRGEGKKKVVIIGEMSDLAFEMATNASASTNYALDDVTFADPQHDHDHYEDRPPPMSSYSKYPSAPYEREHHYHHRFPSHYSGSRYYPSASSPSYSSTGHYGKRGYSRPKSQFVTKKTMLGPPTSSSTSPGSVFVPVAAYSVTHSRVGPNGVRRMRPGKQNNTCPDMPLSCLMRTAKITFQDWKSFLGW